MRNYTPIPWSSENSLGIQLRSDSFSGAQKPLPLASFSSKDTSETVLTLVNYVIRSDVLSLINGVQTSNNID